MAVSCMTGDSLSLTAVSCMTGDSLSLTAVSCMDEDLPLSSATYQDHTRKGKEEVSISI